MAPLVDVLRMVDREEKPCMGYLCEAMKRAEGQIEKNLGSDIRTWTKVKTIIDRRWEYQLHRPLHAAGFYLNPSIYFKETKTLMEINSVVKTGLFKAMAVLILESESDAAMDELKLYRDAEGTFGIKSAISRRATMQPQKRFKERLADSDSDPILLKEIDENDDWIILSETQLEDFVVEGDDLTWEQVRAARGADIDVGPSTRNRTRNSVTIRDEADDEEDEVDFEAHTGGGEQGEGNRDDDDVNGSDDDIDIEVGDD
ncbi:hypothetical protein IFM89_034765 [Coptis chinensis]|uniref:Uncharacterized protein n=1 Tax=Coptis chinensis TaxID=261450 RepID=A0A835HAN5_9MAGN|nr:hypothetical protein IFM89_034765 [Coptis chinensis]